MGLGKVVGNFVTGLISDKFNGGVAVAKYMMVFHVAGFILLTIYNETHEYSVISFLALFLLGY